MNITGNTTSEQLEAMRRFLGDAVAIAAKTAIEKLDRQTAQLVLDKQHRLKIIRVAICFYQRELSFLSRFCSSVFHAQHAFKAFAMNVCENISVIHFAGAGFIPARIIADLEIGNFIVCPIYIVNQVACIALNVVHVEQYFTNRAIHRFANRIGLVGRAQK